MQQAGAASFQHVQEHRHLKKADSSNSKQKSTFLLGFTAPLAFLSNILSSVHKCFACVAGFVPESFLVFDSVLLMFSKMPSYYSCVCVCVLHMAIMRGLLFPVTFSAESLDFVH